MAFSFGTKPFGTATTTSAGTSLFGGTATTTTATGKKLASERLDSA